MSEVEIKKLQNAIKDFNANYKGMQGQSDALALDLYSRGYRLSPSTVGEKSKCCGATVGANQDLGTICDKCGNPCFTVTPQPVAPAKEETYYDGNYHTPCGEVYRIAQQPEYLKHLRTCKKCIATPEPPAPELRELKILCPKCNQEFITLIQQSQPKELELRGYDPKGWLSQWAKENGYVKLEDVKTLIYLVERGVGEGSGRVTKENMRHFGFPV